MPGDKDEKTRREQAEAAQRLQDLGMGLGPDAHDAGKTAQGGQRPSGSAGFASGLQPGGTKPGGGPGAGPGSLGTGGASTGGAPTGSLKRGGS